MKPLPASLESQSVSARAIRLNQPGMSSQQAFLQAQRVLQGEQSQFPNGAVIAAHFRARVGVSPVLVHRF